MRHSRSCRAVANESPHLSGEGAELQRAGGPGWEQAAVRVERGGLHGAAGLRTQPGLAAPGLLRRLLRLQGLLVPRAGGLDRVAAALLHGGARALQQGVVVPAGGDERSG